MPTAADISLVLFYERDFLLHNTLMTSFNVLMKGLVHIGEKPLIFGSGSIEFSQNTVPLKKCSTSILMVR
jgi:hypothetical protein